MTIDKSKQQPKQNKVGISLKCSLLNCISAITYADSIFIWYIYLKLIMAAEVSIRLLFHMIRDIYNLSTVWPFGTVYNREIQ